MHPDTLFHLVPNNKVASSALLHPDNKHLVSNSSVNDEPGLEVGYHATSVPRGHVIARLGRDADLILSEGSSDLPMSGIHIAFEINPATQVILLSVRSKRTSSVTFSMKTPEDKINGKNKGKDKQKDKEITGDGVIAYTQDYNISIASYHFTLVWRRIHRKELEAIAVEGYEESVKRCQQMLVSRRRPTEAGISEAQTWHLTRLNVAHPIFQDVIQLRTKLGQGSYGKVYKAIDQTTGHAFAIKVVDLQASDNPNAARTLLHREVETMERLRHVSFQYYNAPFIEQVETNAILEKHHRVARISIHAHSSTRNPYAPMRRIANETRQVAGVRPERKPRQNLFRDHGTHARGP